MAGPAVLCLHSPPAAGFAAALFPQRVGTAGREGAESPAFPPGDPGVVSALLAQGGCLCRAVRVLARRRERLLSPPPATCCFPLSRSSPSAGRSGRTGAASRSGRAAAAHSLGSYGARGSAAPLVGLLPHFKARESCLEIQSVSSALFDSSKILKGFFFPYVW